MLRSARSIELLPECISYLIKLFNTYKVNVGGRAVLDHHAIEKIFQPCPPHDGMPFDPRADVRCEESSSSVQYAITFDIWIALWQKSFCENPWRAFKFLVYTGFVGRMRDVIQPIQFRIKDIINSQNLESR